jgi:hypothetical protein
MKFDPPRLTGGPVTGRVYVVTHGKVREDGVIVASVKYDVTDQFDALVAGLPARARGAEADAI